MYFIFIFFARLKTTTFCQLLKGQINRKIIG